jgi:hypothetical protein
MDEGKFIRCHHCDAIHHVTPFDKAPVYALVSGQVETSSADDWRAFMEGHAHHKLEPLRATGEKYFGTRNPMDPMGVGYLEVTNGQEKFLLRRSRKSIAEPLAYELVKGKTVGPDATVEVQETEIKKEIKYHFNWTPALPPSDDKIDLFIALLKCLVKEIDPNTIQVTEYSYTGESVAYGRLNQDVIDALMRKCAAYFLAAEQEAICRFIHSHREGCDVMTLRVRQHFSVEDSAP